MGKKTLEVSERPCSSGRSTLSTRLDAVRYLSEPKSFSRAGRTTSIQHIADALVAAGYTSLDKQAKALGIHRATAWTIIKTKHKLGRLNTATTSRMLENPELPPSVRAILLQYVADRPMPRQSPKR